MYSTTSRNNNRNIRRIAFFFINLFLQIKLNRVQFRVLARVCCAFSEELKIHALEYRNRANQNGASSNPSNKYFTRNHVTQTVNYPRGADKLGSLITIWTGFNGKVNLARDKNRPSHPRALFRDSIPCDFSFPLLEISSQLRV